MTVEWKAILLSVTLSPSQYTYESYEPKIAQVRGNPGVPQGTRLNFKSAVKEVQPNSQGFHGFHDGVLVKQRLNM